MSLIQDIFQALGVVFAGLIVTLAVLACAGRIKVDYGQIDED